MQGPQRQRARSKVKPRWGWTVEGYDFIPHRVADHGNAEIATLTVFTEGWTPEETCAEILKHVK